MGFRTRYPQRQHFGILNLLSWRSLRKWQTQEGHSDLLPETGLQTLLWEVPSLIGRKGASSSLLRCQGGCKPTGPAQFPLAYYNSLILFNLSYSSTAVHSSSNVVSKCTGLNCFFISLWRLPCQATLTGNTFGFFSVKTLRQFVKENFFLPCKYHHCSRPELSNLDAEHIPALAGKDSL